MINAFLNGIISFISNVASVYTYPVNLVLTTFFPDITDILEIVTNVLNQVLSVLGWYKIYKPPKN